MTDRGNFRVARGIFDHPILDGEPFDKRSAWLWLISEASWEPRKVERGGRCIVLKRGEAAHSLRYMGEAWGWDHKRVGRFLERLTANSMVRIRTEGGVSVVTVLNYERYQTAKNAGQDRDSSGTVDGTSDGGENGTAIEDENRCPTANSSNDEAVSGTGSSVLIGPPGGSDLFGNRDNTKEQINKEKNIICFPAKGSPRQTWPSDAFESWYGLYPRKKSPKRARKAFERVRQSGEISLNELLAKTQRYADTVRRSIRDGRLEERYVPHPATWLNDGKYAEEIESGLPTGDTPKTNQPERDPRTFTAAEWQRRLAHFEKERCWPVQHWGPEPGRVDCLVPRSLLAAAGHLTSSPGSSAK
jgi:hypothetical protein